MTGSTTTKRSSARHGEPTTATSGRPSGLASVLTQMWLVPLVVVAWEFATRRAQATYFPPPSEILLRMHELWFSGPAAHLFLTDAAIGNFLPSLGRMFGGWVLACVLGVGLGIAIGRSTSLSDYVGPLVEFGRAIPPPTLIPLFILIFKIGPQMQLATILYGVIWPILINSIDGARYVDRVHSDTAQVFGLGKRQRLFRIILPAAGPKVFAGLRLSLALAVILMVISELAGSTEGIGNQLLYTQQTFDLAGMWSIIVLLGVLGFVLNASFLGVERRVLSWHRRARQTT